jgi:hypothetical protein
MALNGGVIEQRELSDGGGELRAEGNQRMGRKLT